MFVPEFTRELLIILSGDSVGIPGGPWGGNMFGGSSKMLPDGSGPFLNIVETGGTSPDNTQKEVIVPAYQRPGAQIVVTAESSPVAYDMARRAYYSLVKIRNMWIGSGDVSATGTWYRSIRPLQEPFDLGLGPKGRPRWAFNVLGDKRPTV